MYKKLGTSKHTKLQRLAKAQWMLLAVATPGQ